MPVRAGLAKPAGLWLAHLCRQPACSAGAGSEGEHLGHV